MSAEFSPEQKTERGSKYIFVKQNTVKYWSLQCLYFIVNIMCYEKFE